MKRRRKAKKKVSAYARKMGTLMRSGYTMKEAARKLKRSRSRNTRAPRKRRKRSRKNSYKAPRSYRQSNDLIF